MTASKKDTRARILRAATKMFFHEGYGRVTSRSISDYLGISPGNLTYYFPTKEHILAVIVEMLCDFQAGMMDKELGEGMSPLHAYLMELTAMASASAENELMREFYIFTYTHPMTLEIIRCNDTKKAKAVFSPFCPHWSDDDFAAAEEIVSGIEYAILMTSGSTVDMQSRIALALQSVMKIYNVPDGQSQELLSKVMATNYRDVGNRIVGEFLEYLERV